MAYAAAGDLYNRYGIPNCYAWADIEGLGYANNSTQINARIAYALNLASDQMDDRFRASKFSLRTPLPQLSGGGYPTCIIDSCVKLAGEWLASARGYSDRDQEGRPISPLWADKLDALRNIEEIVSGKQNLGPPYTQ
jgi:hypothetical protein